MKNNEDIKFTNGSIINLRKFDNVKGVRGKSSSRVIREHEYKEGELNNE
ncbi:MAG: hypothetical protein RSA91_00575 [Bacilli bacterium]